MNKHIWKSMESMDQMGTWWDTMDQTWKVEWVWFNCKPLGYGQLQKTKGKSICRESCGATMDHDKHQWKHDGKNVGNRTTMQLVAWKWLATPCVRTHHIRLSRSGSAGKGSLKHMSISNPVAGLSSTLKYVPIATNIWREYPKTIFNTEWLGVPLFLGPFS